RRKGATVRNPIAESEGLVSVLHRNSVDCSTALASRHDTAGTLIRYPSSLTAADELLARKERDDRPRVFYPGMAFLPGTRPLSGEGSGRRTVSLFPAKSA